MANLRYRYERSLVVKAIDHPIVSNSHAPTRTILHFLASGWPGVIRQSEDDLYNSFPNNDINILKGF